MTTPLDTRARRLVDLKTRYQKLTKEAEAAEREYRAEEREFWIDMEEVYGKVKTITLDLGEGYGDIQLQRRETITSKVIDPDRAATALEALGLDEAMLGERTIRKKPLNQHVKELLEADMPLPEGVDFHARRYITITRKGD